MDDPTSALKSQSAPLPGETNAELETLRKKCERLQLLQQVGTVIHSTLDPQEALQLIVDEAVRVMRASSGSVVLVNPTNRLLEIHAANGLPLEAMALKLPVGSGVTGWVARTGKTARVPDVTADPRYVMVKGGVRSEMAVPLEVMGEVRGVINVDSDRLNAFSQEDEDLLIALASQAARVVYNTWLYEQWRQKARLLEALASVSRVINSTLNLDDALTVITREACGLMSGKVCSLMLLDSTGQWLDLRASFGAGEAYTTNARLGVEESFLGVVVRRRKAMQVENVQTSTRYQRADVARQENLAALLSVPLLFAGESIGALNVYKREPYSFSDEEVRVLSAVAELSAIAIEKARLYERVVDVEELLRQNEKLSALGLLAAEVAHEIRNPLTVMKMLYHSLDLKFPESDPRTKDAFVIGEKIEHLNRIVEQILQFARTTEPELKPVALNELVEELSLLVRHKFKQQQVSLVLNLAPTLPQVAGDAGQLEQAFLNLMLNAAEAMSGGGTLQISSHFSSGNVVLEFTDNGQGMTEEQCDRAFKTILSTTKSGGTGLGLAIVGRVVEIHHGEVKMKSTLGEGTTATILIPALKSQSEAS